MKQSHKLRINESTGRGCTDQTGHDEAITARSAARDVSGIVELVNMIFAYLDEVDLIRVQRVKKQFRKIIRETEAIQKRLGVKPFDAVVSEDWTEVAWHPFWDHLTTREFVINHGGWGYDDSALARGEGPVMLHFLPNATCELGRRKWKRPKSILWSTAATIPPVDCVVIFTANPTDLYGRKNTLVRASGVTIGHVLEAWVKHTVPCHRHYPVVMCPRRQSAIEEFVIKDSLDRELDDMQSLMYGTVVSNRVITKADYPVQAWYYCEKTDKDEDVAEWWSLRGADLAREMTKVTQLIKQVGETHVLPADE